MRKSTKLALNKKTIKRLKLKLEPRSDRKAAPITIVPIDSPTNGSCDLSHPWYTC